MDMLGSPNSPDSLPPQLLLSLLVSLSLPLLPLLLSPPQPLPSLSLLLQELNTVLVGAALLVPPWCVVEDSSSSDDSSLLDRSPHSPPSEGSASTSLSPSCACSVHACSIKQ
jgi:hypothetical protein